VHRFFEPAEALRGDPILLGGDIAHQMRRVLRLRPGQVVQLLDGAGGCLETTVLSFDDAGVRLQKIGRGAAEGEPATQITLFQAVLKGDRFDWALQKGTEVGAARFVPMICQRSVRADPAALNRKHDRWQRIIQEAAEQSGRALIPPIERVLHFAQAVQPCPSESSPASLPVRLLLWEEESGLGLRDALRRSNLYRGCRIQLYVGPEGGFSADEVALARNHGVLPVTLGRRILRSETAGLVAATIVLCEAGEL
jgi:16S rRNA (uracil1498-N3)-methyltransferase